MLDHANYLYYNNVDSFDGGHAKVVVGTCHYAPGIFLLVLQFSFLYKNQHSKFQFDQERGPIWNPAIRLIWFQASSQKIL